VGVKLAAVLRWALLPVIGGAVLQGAPKLRLTTAAVGPISIAQGAAGTPQTVEAYNAGDGSLNLNVESSSPWAAPSVNAARPCSNQPGVCLPIVISLPTASLAKGTYTAIITVRDPNAIDAPQTITVTVQIGGGVPDRLDLYVAPNGSAAETRFFTNGPISAVASTQTGGQWLTVTLEGAGSFRFVFPYVVRAAPQPGMGEGVYSGSVTVSNSLLAAENKTIPVTLNVTSRPVIAATPQNLRLRLAQNAPKQLVNVVLFNRGLGVLSIEGVTTSGGDWLAAQRIPGYDMVRVTVTAAGPLGIYTGLITVTSNAANGPLTIPVELEIVPAGPPFAYYQGAVNNATFEPGEAVAPGDLVALYGEQLSASDPETPPPPPPALPVNIGGVQVLVNDRPAPLFYTSYGQINFQAPYDTPVGEARVRVIRGEVTGEVKGNEISMTVAAHVPRILRLGIQNYGIAVNQDGSFPLPAISGLNSRPAKPGEALVIYAIGFGQTSPPVRAGDGAPGAEPLARVSGVTVFFGSTPISTGVPVTPLFVGLTPNFVGLYQVNVVVPEDAPRSDRVPIRIDVNGASSNHVDIAIQ
jgi:uncharacterized protein (TIGR03437 family)